MSAPKQWLVVPKNPSTAAYVTSNPDVAEKRTEKGDTVTPIKRKHEEDDEL